MKSAWLERVLRQFDVDVCFIQEHNYKYGYELRLKGYQMSVGSSLRLKGGVEVAIKESSPFRVLAWEEGGGRVVRVEGIWGEVRVCFLGVYMPAEGFRQVKMDFVRDVLFFCGVCPW